jgi:hypothetical protein
MAENIANLPPAGHRPLPERSGAPGTQRTASGGLWESSDGPSFEDLLDVINPLQHIPVVSSIYRAITGDQIGMASRTIGGFLFGGQVGALVAGITGLFEEATGGSVATHIATVYSEVFGDEEKPTTAIASAEPVKSGTPAPAPAVTQAADAAGEIDAAMMNRIAFNPAAAPGVPLSKRPATGATQVAFPAHSANAVFPASAASTAAVPPANSAADRLRAGTLQSQRTRADALVARWAEKQMTRQAAAPDANAQADAKRKQQPQAADESAAPHHPMPPPRNASPEWYAAVMKSALDRYQAGQSTHPAIPQGYNPNR